MAKPTESLSDAQLIEALQQPRTADAALRQLYRTQYGGLEHYVLANSGTEADAQDNFQEALIALVNLVRSGRFRGESSLKTLLFALNRNLWLNELKRRGRAQAREERFSAEEGEWSPAQALALEQQETKEELLAALEQLGDACRQILLGFYWENLSIREILSRLPYENEQVVRNKKGKCLKKLEALIRSKPGLFRQLKNDLYG